MHLVDSPPTSNPVCSSTMCVCVQVNQQERILYSSGKNNFVNHLAGYKHFTAEEKDEITEILEKEVMIEKKE